MAAHDLSTLVSVFEGITTKLAASEEPNRLYDAAVQIAMETTDAQACSLYLEQNVLDGAGEPGSIVMVSGAGFEKLRIGARYTKGQGLTGGIWQTSRSVKLDTREQIEDPSRGWRGLHNGLLEAQQPGWMSYSLIGVPLKVGRKTIGVLKVENKNPGRPSCFSVDDQVMLETIASTIGLAIENQRQSERSFSAMLSVLHDVSQMLVSTGSWSFRMLGDRVVEKCIDVFNAEACSLYIQEGRSGDVAESDHIVMISGAGYERFRIGARYRKAEGLTGTIWARSAPVKYDSKEDIEDPGNGWKGVYNQQVAAERVTWECRSLMGVPLRIGNSTIGVLKVENKKPVGQSHFSHNELRSLDVLASNIAIALEMHRRRATLFEAGEAARLFAHGLPNRIGNVLSSIQNATQSLGASELANREDVAKALRFLELAKGSVEKIARFRDEVLAVRGAAHEKHQTAVDKLLRLAIEHCHSQLAAGNVKVNWTLPPKTVYTNVCADDVIEALSSLIANAVDAVRSVSAPEIGIELEIEPGTAIDRAIVRLVDNGPGLSQTQKDEFAARRSISSTKAGGHGIGVRSADRFLNDNEIILRLPHASRQLPLAGAAFELVFVLCEPLAVKVLAIDDDEAFLELLRLKTLGSRDIDLATRENFQLVLEACEGDEAAVRGLRVYDLILLDFDFSGASLTGLHLLNRLRDSCPEIASRVRLMSGMEEYQTRRDVKVLNKYRLLDAVPDGLHELRRTSR